MSEPTWLDRVQDDPPFNSDAPADDAVMTQAHITTLTEMRMKARWLSFTPSVRHIALGILDWCNAAEAILNGEPLKAQSIEEMVDVLKGALSYGTGK